MPEILLVYRDVIVYHCYTDQNMVSDNWYTTDETWWNTDYHDSPDMFDVRDLDAWDPDLTDEEIIRRAIETGEIS